MTDSLVTVEEAAARLGLSVASVRRRCAAGDLACQKVGRSWLIDASALPRRRASAGLGQVSAIVDFNEALRHLRTQDLRRDVWAPDVLLFADDLAEQGSLIARAAEKVDLLAAPDPAISVLVTKSPLFARQGTDLSLADRLAYQATVQEIVKVTDPRLSPRSYASRLTLQLARSSPGSGVTRWLQWRGDGRKALVACRGWMAQTDITRYFDFIEHRKLMQLLAEERRIPQQILRSLQAMLSAWALRKDIGLPQGPDASRPLANFYMVEVDEALTSMSEVEYFRYMDDIIVVSASRAAVTRALRRIGELTYELGLPISTQKTEVLPFQTALARLNGEELRAVGNSYGETSVEDASEPDEDPSYLASVFGSAVADEGKLAVRPARYSLYRLYRVKSDVVLPAVLRSIDDLGPLGPLVPRYLSHWIDKPTVGESIGKYLNDPERNTSEYFAAWLMTAPLEHPTSVDLGIIDYARRCRGLLKL